MNAALEQLLGRRDLWRGGHRLREQPALASEHAELDALLPGGGWPLGALTEICSAHAGMGEVSLLLPALARLNRDAHWIAWIAPPHLSYAPALRQAGIDPARCLLIEPTQRIPDVSQRSEVTAVQANTGAGAGARFRAATGFASTTPRKPEHGTRFPTRGNRALTPLLWSAEQLLRGGSCAAVLLWWDGEDHHALRRLQLAAEATGALGVLFRPAAAASRLSPAALRLRVEADSAIEIMKCRGADLRAARGQRLRVLSRQSWWTQGVSQNPSVVIPAQAIPTQHCVIPSAARDLALPIQSKIPRCARDDMIDRVTPTDRVTPISHHAAARGERERRS